MNPREDASSFLLGLIHHAIGGVGDLAKKIFGDPEFYQMKLADEILPRFIDVKTKLESIQADYATLK